MKYKINYAIVSIISMIAIAIVFFILFNLTGLRIALGMVLIYGIGCLIFNQLPLEPDEKFFFGMFISFAMFPLLAWFMDRIVQSFRISIILTIFIIVLVGAVLWFRRRKE